MDVLLDSVPDLLRAFWVTVKLFLLSGVGSLILGTVLATLRVCPVPVLRGGAAAFVTIVRNTPLVLVFVWITFGMPAIGIQGSFFRFAVIALTVYTAAFVCEAIRSGINAVSAGQAEAARALGMTFRQNLTLIVLPQAARTVIPPLTNLQVALIRNTAVAEAFGVAEASFELSGLLRDNPTALYPLFFGVAFGYMFLVAIVAGGSKLLERRLAIVR
ncbi:MAG: amino acid ABC transporter permease [Sporichthyaceae bacterium]